MLEITKQQSRRWYSRKIDENNTIKLFSLLIGCSYSLYFIQSKNNDNGNEKNERFFK